MDCGLKYRLRALTSFLLWYTLLVALIPILLPVAIDLVKDQGRLIRAGGIFITCFLIFIYMVYLIGRYQTFRDRFTADLHHLHDWRTSTAAADGMAPTMVCRRCGRQITGGDYGNQTTD